MSDDEREGGEITDDERSPRKDSRNQHRYRDRDRERSPRNDVYFAPVGHWERERDRDRDRRRDRYYGRRDDREWTRDTGRGGYYRDERRGWRDDRDRDRDAGRDRYDDRDRDRDQRNAYERPRHRDELTRDERRRDDTYERIPDRDTYRPDAGAEDQYKPRRRTSPEPPYRSGRKGSASRTRDDGASRYQRRRDDSVDSRHSGPRRGRDDWERPSQAFRKRERSRSPVDRDNRAQRRLRTNSPEPSPSVSRRKSPSPVPPAQRQEEKLPGHQVPPLRHLAVPLDKAGPSSEQSPVPSPAAEKSGSPVKTRTPVTLIPVTPGAPIQSPTKTLKTSITPSARSAALAPPPRRHSPKIPEWSNILRSVRARHRYDILPESYEIRPKLYDEFARSSAELQRVTLEAEISAIEFRTFELRRMFAEQQRQRAMEA